MLIRGGSFVLDNSTISANVTGPGPVIDGAESIGGGIDIQVSQECGDSKWWGSRNKCLGQCQLPASPTVECK